MYEYQCQVLRVIDGDTLHLDVDLGLDIHTRMTVRLYGINTPEMKTAEGPPAKAFVSDWVWRAAWAATPGNGSTLTLTTVKDRREKYGRYLGVLNGPEGELNRALLEAGHATVYKT